MRITINDNASRGKCFFFFFYIPLSETFNAVPEKKMLPSQIFTSSPTGTLIEDLLSISDDLLLFIRLNGDKMNIFIIPLLAFTMQFNLLKIYLRKLTQTGAAYW